MDHTSVQPAAHRSGLLLEDPDSASGKGKGLLIGVREYRQWSLGPQFFSGTSKKKGCPWDPISESPQPSLCCPCLLVCQLSFLSQMSQLLWSIAIFASEIFLSFSRDLGHIQELLLIQPLLAIKFNSVLYKVTETPKRKMTRWIPDRKSVV